MINNRLALLYGVFILLLLIVIGLRVGLVPDYAAVNPLNPGELFSALSSYFNSWNENLNFGVTNIGFPRVPGSSDPSATPPLKIFRMLLLPFHAPLGQLIFEISVMLVVFLSAFLLIRYLLILSFKNPDLLKLNIASFFGALFYLINPYFSSFIHHPFIKWHGIGYAILPLQLLLLFIIARSRRFGSLYWVTTGMLFLLLTFISHFFIHNLVIFFFISCIYTFTLLIFKQFSQLLHLTVAGLAIFFGIIIVNLFWLIPNILWPEQSISRIPTYFNGITTNVSFTLRNVLTNRSTDIYHKALSQNTTLPPAPEAVGWIVLAVALFGLTRLSRIYALSLFLILLLSIFISKGLNPPFQQLSIHLFSNPLMQGFRDPAKFLAVFSLINAIGIAAGFFKLKKFRRLVGVMLLLILFLSNPRYFSGFGNYYYAQKRTLVADSDRIFYELELPAAYDKLLSQVEPEKRIAILPTDLSEKRFFNNLANPDSIGDTFSGRLGLFSYQNILELPLDYFISKLNLGGLLCSNRDEPQLCNQLGLSQLDNNFSFSLFDSPTGQFEIATQPAVLVSDLGSLSLLYRQRIISPRQLTFFYYQNSFFTNSTDVFKNLPHIFVNQTAQDYALNTIFKNFVVNTPDITDDQKSSWAHATVLMNHPFIADYGISFNSPDPLISSKTGTIKIPLSTKPEGNYLLFARLIFHPEGSIVKLKVGEKDTIIDTKTSNYTGGNWLYITSVSGPNTQLVLDKINDTGLAVVGGIALIPEEELSLNPKSTELPESAYYLYEQEILEKFSSLKNFYINPFPIKPTPAFLDQGKHYFHAGQLPKLEVETIPVSSHKVSDGEYILDFSLPQDGFLVFKQSYSPNFILNSRPDSPHLISDYYSNAFYLPKGVYSDVVLEHRPAAWYRFGLWFSVFVYILIAVCVLILYPNRSKFKSS